MREKADSSMPSPIHGHDHGHGHNHDHSDGHDHGHGHDHGDACCHGPADGSSGADTELPVGAGQVRTRFRINEMDCPTEATLIRGKLDGMPQVHGLSFDLIQRVLIVVHDADSRERVAAAVKAVGMNPEVITADRPALDAPVQAPIRWRMLLLGGVLAAAAELAHYAGLPQAVTAACAVAAILACGLKTYRKGWIAIRNGNLNINALMSIAVTGAAAIGQWPEAAMVMFLFNVAELIEARSLERARNAVRGLLDLAPQNATVRQPDGDWKEVPAAGVVVGSEVRVRPGERIAADGVITTGASTVDQSPITGESIPVEKNAGDTVYAATVNGAGSFEYRVTAASGDSTLARIIHAVEQAQGARAPTQRFIDRFSRWYTPIVVTLAVLVAVLPPVLAGMDWSDSVYRALALLIIACPCALVISTPVSIVSGLTAASRRGILVKGGVYLENGRRLRWLALDKTGTLTHGKPVRTDLRAWQGTLDTAAAQPLCAALAARSDHPVSQAIAQGVAQDVPEVSEFKALPGRGVSGVIEGSTYYLGNRRLMNELGVAQDDGGALAAALDAYEQQGKTAVTLTDGQRVLALAAVADTVKPGSRAAIEELHALGIRTVMLTGDNVTTAQAIGAEVGIDEVHGEQLPEHKLQAVEAKAGQGMVGMVGDGINDAPALARADIGFAMGAAGTGTAIETADVALMDDDLRKIAEFVRLSRATHAVLVQNIVFALAVKVVFLMLAATGHATLWMAVFADVGASLLVVANGMRLLRAARPARASAKTVDAALRPA
jgi:Cd2+/Zn2+-exporting ATPase